MNQEIKKLWQTAAELFAMSISELCPKIVFKTIRADYLGFCIEYILDEELPKDMLKHAVSRMNERKKIDVVEMVSTNVVEYMKYQKQPIRAAQVDTTEQFTKVIKIDDVYGDLLEGEAETDLSKIRAVEIEAPIKIGEEVFRRRKTPLYQIKGYAFQNTQELKKHKKTIKKAESCDHRSVAFEGNLITLWRDTFIDVANFLNKSGYKEKWRNSELSGKEFCEVEEEIDEVANFGLKANGMFRGIKIAHNHFDESFKKDLFNTLNIPSDTDIYGIKWPLIEFGHEVKIWIDRAVALKIEEKCVSKKASFSKVVT